MHALLQSLTGGDRRSIGQANAAAAHVLAHPQDAALLVDGMHSADPVLRMRCADALEKASAQKPALLAPHADRLLGGLARSDQQEVRWHLAPMLVRLPLSEAQTRQVLDTLLNYTNDASSIVKTMAMQALADLAARCPALRAEVLRHVEELTVIGTPAMKARGRKLTQTLTRPAKVAQASAQAHS